MILVKDFIDDYRMKIGDAGCDTPTRYILAWLNTALKRLARTKGLDRLFTFQDTFELSAINADGTPSNTWNLNADNMGMILDIKSLLITDSRQCQIHKKCICYLPFDRFRNEYSLTPCVGEPEAYTITQIDGKTRIIFDKAISSPFAVDMVYTAYHPKITSDTEKIRFPLDYEDLLLEFVSIYQDQESSDFAFARARIEDMDYLVAQAREQLAKYPSTLGHRSPKGGW